MCVMVQKMKTMFNLTTSSDDMDRFLSREDLLKLMQGFDGVELMQFEEDSRGLIPKERVIGLHMGYFPYWLDFWRGNEDALIKEFDSRETWERMYGGKDRSVLLDRFRQDLAWAHHYHAEYVVFHVSQATIEETFTWKYQYTDEEVIDATKELLNELLKDEDGKLVFLVENLWQPGLTFTRPAMTKRLLEGIEYPNKGIMLDTGHLLHTNTAIRTQEEGLQYIHSLLDDHGELCRYIRGVHLNQSLTGEYCEKTINDPPKLGDTYQERYGKMFWHAFKVDQHLPFTCAGVDQLIRRIAPEYLTFEFITTDSKQHREYLTAQRKALGMEVMQLTEQDQESMNLKEIISNITPVNQAVFETCEKRFDKIAKPVGSLGKLEKLIERIAAASDTAEVDIRKKCVLVFCADNGVLTQGVAQSTHDVTTAIARSLVRGTTSVSVMAKACGADVFPINMGMVDRVDGLLDYSIKKGTNDITRGPAMSREEAIKAISAGIDLVGQRVKEGYSLIATGEAGIGNTTTSSAILSVVLEKPVAKVTGRGSGLSDAGLLRKQQAIAKAIRVNQPDKEDVIDVISKVGGFDIAAMTGAFLGGALYHVPVIMDGFISGVAALCAARLCPAVMGYLLPSHVSAEPAGQMLMKALGLDPMLHGDMRLGEGTGAVALMPLLDLAVAVYRNAASFEEIQVEAYEKWKSN